MPKKERFCMACEGKIDKDSDLRDICPGCFRRLKRLERERAKRGKPQRVQVKHYIARVREPGKTKYIPVPVPKKVEVVIDPLQVFLAQVAGKAIGKLVVEMIAPTYAEAQRQLKGHIRRMGS